MECFFVTDLHGDIGKYRLLFRQILKDQPNMVFIGGDLLAGSFLRNSKHSEDIINNILAKGFYQIKQKLSLNYPSVFIIMGNDDSKSEENLLIKYDKKGFWHYINQKHLVTNKLNIFGYSWVPPTPFLNKDWERYDVSRFVDIGCVAPEAGYHTTKFSQIEAEHRTIWEDLQEMTRGFDLTNAIVLFHAPPYQTGLDRAALDGKMIDYAPLDVHVGSIAIKRFIEQYQPLITLHGHVHESFSITNIWKEKIGRTICMSAANNTKSLTLVKFSTENPYAAQRFELQ